MPDGSSVCSSLRSRVSPEEWEARIELAALYRVVARYGWTDVTNNHITLKVPGTDDQFLLNPHGLGYDEITASSLMKIDSKANIVLQPDHGYGINYTGYVIHGAIHDARPDVHCILHTHTRAGIAVSTMECGLLMTNQSTLFLVGNVAYHDYEGPALELDERVRLVANLGTKDTMILRNHGLLSCGRTVGEAFLNMYYLEGGCRIQVDQLASGQKITQVDQHAADFMQKTIADYKNSGMMAKLEWGAELRRLDRIDPSYRN